MSYETRFYYDKVCFAKHKRKWKQLIMQNLKRSKIIIEPDKESDKIWYNKQMQTLLKFVLQCKTAFDSDYISVFKIIETIR